MKAKIEKFLDLGYKVTLIAENDQEIEGLEYIFEDDTITTISSRATNINYMAINLLFAKQKIE